MEKKTLVIIIAITILATVLRFYRLGQIPNGLHRDEAFLGYNAYSILKTGRDMSGKFLPLHLQSFVYSPTGYSYLSIPFIKLSDLNAFSVRFASALFGVLTIPLAFALAEMLTRNKRIALLTAILLTISPWHINLSRTATENTVTVFFVTLGVYIYLRWRQKPDIFKLILVFFCFTLTLVIYQAPRAFLPIFIPFMVLVFGLPKRQKSIIAGLYFVTIIFPLILILSSPQLSLRIKSLSIFSSSGTQLTLDEYIREDGVSDVKNLTTRVFHNKLAGYADQFFTNYFNHYSYDFLFTDKGLPDRYRIANVGLLYLFELPLILIGIHILWLKHRKIFVFALGWLLMVPVGSALTFDDIPNLQRTLLVFPALSLIVACGADELISFSFSKKILNSLLFFGKILLLLVAIYNFLFYLHQYYIHKPIHRPWYRNEGYQAMVTAVNNLLPDYKKAIVTTRESAPAIFFLFFSKYDPASFQKETYSPAPIDLDRANFSKYEFSQEECPLRLAIKTDPKTGLKTEVFTGTKGVLYVNSGICETPVDYATELMKFTRGDSAMVFRIVTAK